MKKNNPISILRGRVIFLSLLYSLVCASSGWGQKSVRSFEFNQELQVIYENIILLELDQGRDEITRFKIKYPNNVLVYHIENYIDFFTCFIDEDEAHFNRIRDRKEERIDKLQTGDQSSPYYLFSQAEVLLQWSLVRLKFEEYVTALVEMNKAIKMLERNEELFPDFLPNKKSLSALHAMVGTIPAKYKNMLSWVSSFNGTIEQGYKEIQIVANNLTNENEIWRKEVVAIQALIELHLVNDKQAAYRTVTGSQLAYQNNPLLCFIVANVCHKAGYNDQAIETLQSYKATETQHPLYYLDYLTGIYKLNRLDSDSDQYIRRYLSYFKGNNYIKEAYQKLAWYEWALHGDFIEYKRNLRYCISEGSDLIDEDKQALSVAKSDRIPNRNMLKARLLDDGSYEEKALQLLQSIFDEKRTSEEQIEYFYRSGRISQGLSKNNEAIAYYERCIGLPFDGTIYYQTAAALYIAQIYESKQEWKTAKGFYMMCMNLSPDQYKSSLHQKAKAGLQRIEDQLNQTDINHE